MARSDVSQPPKPGEIWSLDENWNPPPIFNRPDASVIKVTKIALVLKELCLGGQLDDEDNHEWSEWNSGPLDPIYRSLVDGQVVDLHWSWFRARLSL